MRNMKNLPDKESRFEIRLAGSGGQGIILIGRLFAAAAVKSSRYVTFFPAYGAEVRGGTSNCHVVLSSDEIASPLSEERAFALSRPYPQERRATLGKVAERAGRWAGTLERELRQLTRSGDALYLHLLARNGRRAGDQHREGLSGTEPS